jgi:hypothetical protein
MITSLAGRHLRGRRPGHRRVQGCFCRLLGPAMPNHSACNPFGPVIR